MLQEFCAQSEIIILHMGGILALAKKPTMRYCYVTLEISSLSHSTKEPLDESERGE